MRYNTEREYNDQLEKIKHELNDLENFFCVYISSHHYDKLLVLQATPVPKIYFKDIEIPYEDLIIFLESLEINCKKYKQKNHAKK